MRGFACYVSACSGTESPIGSLAPRSSSTTACGADRLESSYPAGCRATGPPALQLCHAAAYGASSCCAILPSANNGYTLQIKFRTSYFKKISCGSPTPTSPAALASLPATASSQRCRCRGLNEQRRPHHTTLQHLHSGTVVADLAAGFGRACYL